MSYTYSYEKVDSRHQAIVDEIDLFAFCVFFSLGILELYFEFLYLPSSIQKAVEFEKICFILHFYCCTLTLHYTNPLYYCTYLFIISLWKIKIKKLIKKKTVGPADNKSSKQLAQPPKKNENLK